MRKAEGEEKLKAEGKYRLKAQGSKLKAIGRQGLLLLEERFALG
jgi:hypothetical protein